MFGTAVKMPSTSQRAKVITLAIAQFIIKDLRPFSVVENSGFKNMVQILEPKYTLPSRQHFSDKMVPDIYEDVKNNVKKELHGKNVALTTDGWTSRAIQSYITITTSYIDNDWKLRSYVLQVSIIIINNNR